MNLEAMKEEVCKYNKLLPEHGLVAWTSGNVSLRDPDSGLVVVKPSGMTYDDLTPEEVLVMDLDGNCVEGSRNPSVDTPAHLYILRHMKDVHSVIHTHSAFATSFAALNQPIKVWLTAIADEFGREIPCGPYCQIGEEEIGKAVVAHIGKSPAILLKQHGVFTVGQDCKSALKAAVMVEDVARTCHYALCRGELEAIPEEEVARAHHRYMTRYGQ